MLIEKQNIRVLPTYSTSRTISEVCATYGLQEAFYLASNENPFGCSPKVNEVFNASRECHRYPDGDGRGLKQAIASLHDCQSNNVVLGSGSNEVLESASKAYVSSGDQVLVSEHSFAMYPIFAQLVDGEAVRIPMRNWQIDLDAFLASITARTRLIYIATVNNPTGMSLDYHELLRFIDQVPSDVLVVLDEAYIEFSATTKSVISLVNNFSNLIVTRTFSKVYGLAGFRVGYGVAHPKVISVLEKVRQPFNVSSIGLAAAEAALADQAFIQQTVLHTLQQRQLMQHELQSNGLNCLASDANFICYRAGLAAQTHYEFLLSKGVIIRPLGAYEMPEWLRVSIGTETENRVFIETIKQWNNR